LTHRSPGSIGRAGRPGRARLAVIAFVAVAAAAVALAALPRPGETDASLPGPVAMVFAVRDAPASLAARLAGAPAHGVRIRLGGHGFALVEVDGEHVAEFEAAWPGAHRLLALPDPDDPVELVQVRESELDPDARVLLDPLTIYREGHSDLRVLALRAADIAALAAASGERRPAGRGGPLHLHLGGAHLMPLPRSLPAAALAPLPAAARAHPYRQNRLGDPAARARARALAGLVDGARIEQTVRDLSTVPGATRYSGQPGNTAARDYIHDALRAIFSAPGDTVFLVPFSAHVDDDTLTLYNVIARRRGERPGSGRYVLGGHYDSTARRTPDWNPAVDPAPGADDNASGTASAIEAARVLALARYDFDLEIVLFGGEEQVLLGSKAYVADSLLADIDQVLGALVLDMVGFNPRAADSMNVLTNYTSEWLADMVGDAEQALDHANGLNELDKVVQPTLNYSDHAPFWGEGASAVLFIENTDIVAHNPHYHRVTDTIDALLAVDGVDLMRRTTEVVVMTLGQYATTAPVGPNPFALPAKGLLVFDADGDLTVEAAAGEDLVANARVMNAGPARAEPVDVAAVLRAGGDVVARADTSILDWGRGVDHEILVPWTAAVNHAGTIEVELTLVENEAIVAHLTGSTALAVRDLVLRDAFIAPNPVQGSLGSGELRLRLTGGADLRCWVFDALGSEVGEYSGRVEAARGIPLDAITGGDLPSGVYILRFEARVPGGGAVVGEETLTFAYAR